MTTSTATTQQPEAVPFAKRVRRYLREGTVVMNLSIAVYLAQLPALDQKLGWPLLLTALGVGIPAGFAWMLLRGSLRPGRERAEPPSSPAPPRRSLPPRSSSSSLPPPNVPASRLPRPSQPAKSPDDGRPRPASTPKPPAS